MTKAWKVVLTAVLVLVVGGIVLGAAGLLTGASTERMIEVVFGGREMLDLLIQTLKQELAAIF